MKVAVTIPEDLALEAYLKAHDEPLEAMVQRALRAYLRGRDLAALLNVAGLEYQLPKRPLGSFTVAKEGSGKGDISINHDAYLAEDTYCRKLPATRREPTLSTGPSDPSDEVE